MTREQELKKALKNLVEAIDKTINDPQWNSVWSIYYSHGFEWNGPNFGKELDVARTILEIRQRKARDKKNAKQKKG